MTEMEGARGFAPLELGFRKVEEMFSHLKDLHLHGSIHVCQRRITAGNRSRIKDGQRVLLWRPEMGMGSCASEGYRLGMATDNVRPTLGAIREIAAKTRKRVGNVINHGIIIEPPHN